MTALNFLKLHFSKLHSVLISSSYYGIWPIQLLNSTFCQHSYPFLNIIYLSYKLVFCFSMRAHIAVYLSLFVKCISEAVSERNGMMRTELRAQLTELLLLSHPVFHVEEVWQLFGRAWPNFPVFRHRVSEGRT